METLPETQQQTFEQTAELIQRAKTGDPAAMPEIRELLKTTPSLFQALGDVAANALVSWIRRFAGDDLIQAEAVGMQMDQLRDELTESSDGPLEKLLVEQLLVVMVQLNYRSTVLGQTNSIHVPGLRHLEDQLDRANRRFVYLVRNLELLRRAGGRAKNRTSSDQTTCGRINPVLESNPVCPDIVPANRIRELVMQMS
tara:strand:- start:242 stop:835 length:594 start_codon:yes stop_codon:yes gene_type:complete